MCYTKNDSCDKLQNVLTQNSFAKCKKKVIKKCDTYLQKKNNNKSNSFTGTFDIKQQKIHTFSNNLLTHLPSCENSDRHTLPSELSSFEKTHHQPPFPLPPQRLSNSFVACHNH